MKPVNLNQLLFHPKTPCLSFYQIPLKAEKGDTSFDSFLDDMLSQLELQGKDELAKLLTKQRSNIQKIFKSYPAQAHGFFLSEKLQGYITLDELFESFCMIGSSFHVRPLLEQLLVNPEFMIVNISVYDIKVYKADFHHVEIIQHYEFDEHHITGGRPVYGTGYLGLVPHKSILALKNIARKVSEDVQYHSYPVVVTGLEEMKKIFLRSFDHTSGVISHYEEDFFEKTCVEILERCKVFRPAIMDFYSAQFKERLKRMIKSKQFVSELDLIVQATIAGKVLHLILPVEKKLWGKIDLVSGSFEIHKRLQKKDPSVDILNELAEEVIRKGGKIKFLGPHFFPPDAQVLAILKGVS